MNDTIIAISTALGVGAISIVRLSGKDAINIVNSCFSGKDLTKVNSHTIHYGYIKDKDEIIDEVLVSVMKSPKTFTTEDVVEINCHGGISTTNKVLELMLFHGARLAEAGEFTKRAFMNGRIDLIEAESVMDLINSKTEKVRKIGINHITGVLSEKIKEFREDLLGLLASIEVNIDYPEYVDIEEMTNNHIKEKLSNIKKQLNKIVKESEQGRIIKEGINVAIVGRPNVGKSSILNKLLGEEKAIVTDIQGTTRDIVEGSINLDGIILNFIDTAGIRETTDKVESIGVEKSIKTIEKADLVLLVLNNNEDLSNDDKKLIEKVKNTTHLIVINKTDLDSKIDEKYLNSNNIVRVNTLNYEGINPLKIKIKELFKLEQLDNSDFTYFSNSRQIALAKEAENIIEDIEKALEDNIPTDMIEIDIKRIWTKLGEIIGDTYEEELIDKLFSQFCLGK